MTVNIIEIVEKIGVLSEELETADTAYAPKTPFFESRGTAMTAEDRKILSAERVAAIENLMRHQPDLATQTMAIAALIDLETMANDSGYSVGERIAEWDFADTFLNKLPSAERERALDHLEEALQGCVERSVDAIESNARILSERLRASGDTELADDLSALTRNRAKLTLADSLRNGRTGAGDIEAAQPLLKRIGEAIAEDGFFDQGGATAKGLSALRRSVDLVGRIVALLAGGAVFDRGRDR